eukprot:gnl/Dysnectes_brevis/7301_a12113_289.p1 GENE.gnl/Dysnectes_brevis/7301_a12113_289~~gnl/Dysnectes_brevis/7301_a12113_289.p1  ORF type:complete len:427 (+),score=-1.45 gnl/Dysnectes_brevis/7301_a12113_289:122-1282(+)
MSPQKTSCGELLCFQCASVHKKCHSCHQSCSLVPLTRFEQNCFRKFFCTCPFEHEGCLETMSILHVELHLEFCPYAVILCPECITPVLNSELSVHLHAHCSKRHVQCLECDADVPAEEYCQHDDEQHPKCTGCKSRYHIPSEGKQHQLKECSICHEKHFACLMDAHMVESGHLGLTVDSLKHSRDCASSLQYDIESQERMEDIQQSMKRMQTHYASMYSRYGRFSEEHKGDSLELDNDGRTLYRSKGAGFESALINDPSGLDSSIWEWELNLDDVSSPVFIGAAPPGRVGFYPGSNFMPGSIGLRSDGQLCAPGQRWSMHDLRYSEGSILLVRLDFIHHTISWRLKDTDKVVTVPLPNPESPYVLAVGIGWYERISIRHVRQILNE